MLPALITEKVREKTSTDIGQFLDEHTTATLTPDFLAEMVKVWVCSDFIAKWCQQNPEKFTQLVVEDNLNQQFDATTYQDKLKLELTEANDKASLSTMLRRVRHQEMVRIAWRDISGAANLEETLSDLSNLADTLISCALTTLNDWLVDEYGQPVDASGDAQSLIVVALGKLGGQELNFSSDVDLMFVYPEEGETTGGDINRSNSALSNSEFFIRLGQQLINVLDETTADGFVYRVDMRLRPFGKSGALALNFDALENYYQSHGREWERYALVKARFLCGEGHARNQLREILRPFIYRRYLDFNVYESLRSMKQLIVKEVERKNINSNVKLGAGGIREIEFISQTFQLIRGGREPGLQNPHLLPTLEQLTTLNYLPDYVTSELKQAYIFLRNTEHRLQEFSDQQTHSIPEDNDSQNRLAYSMDYDNRERFFIDLDKHRQHVKNHFDQVFLAPQKTTPETDPNDISSIWENIGNKSLALDLLSIAGFQDPESAFRELDSLNHSYQYRTIGSQGRNQIKQLIPLLVVAIGQHNNPEKTLARIIKLLESVVQRTTYIALLLENPMALSQLVKLCTASPWIADLLAKHPILLDELLDPRTLYIPPDKNTINKDLKQIMSHVPIDDLEAQMESLRQFKQINVLRVAAADIADALPLMRVSDHLSWIAEAILKQILTVAWHDLVSKHGAPECEVDGQVCESGFAIIAYGKLGGIELGYGSDLDLVFLHGSKDDSLSTPGDKPVTNAVFFTRLGQRIIHMINIHTPSGVLYEVDMRLRPSGASGMLVSNIAAFGDYQHNRAWTWEHQALVRARVVAGDPHVAQVFNAIRHKILGQKRDTGKLKEDVKQMREKMRDANKKSGNEQNFDLKQGRGGIADIEFMVQYGVLAWSQDQPELLEYSDNIRLLECFDQFGRMPHNDAMLLINAYSHYRSKAHKLTLLGESTVVEITTDNKDLVDFREQVIKIWQTLLENDE